MQRILAGIETEYGFLVEGHTPTEQIEDATKCVQSYPGPAFVGWDYGPESPRADLRGFRLDRLAFDPTDALFDTPDSAATPSEVIRADRVLPNGARLYNDHGHPEYATPECWDSSLLAEHDAAGEHAIWQAVRAFSAQSGVRVKAYKNNTDFHGASYGTHESYLCSRSLGFDALYRAVMPMLVARQIVTGAGKVGSESGAKCAYQISQRADFFMEPFNAETLYRRPIFNTRDEPHADPREWVRLHVISGDANMMMACTERKVRLVKFALALATVGEAPAWDIADPVRAFQSISRDVEARSFRIDLSQHSHTDAYQVLESYLAAAEVVLDLDDSDRRAIEDTRALMDQIRHQDDSAVRRVDWLAKRHFIEKYVLSDDVTWSDATLASWDLAYHDIDPEEGLFYGLVAADEVDAQPMPSDLAGHVSDTKCTTRANARAIVVQKFADQVETLCWSSISHQTPSGRRTVYLDPVKEYPNSLATSETIDDFSDRIQAIARS